MDFAPNFNPSTCRSSVRGIGSKESLFQNTSAQANLSKEGGLLGQEKSNGAFTKPDVGLGS
jgi:hypothetical protein